MSEASNGADNLPVIPDKVIDRIRKGKSVALEEVSEAAAEMRDTSQAERKQPVHAEDLRPITRERAAQIVSGSPTGKLQPGIMPRAPQTRRVIPAPFRRESISIRVPGEPRPEWGLCRADEVQEGDIVPDLGLVVSIVPAVRYSDAAEQVPVIRGGPAPLVVKTFSAEDSAALMAAFGTTRVAVGTDIRITGAGGKVLELDALEQVRVFRIPGGGENADPSA